MGTSQVIQEWITHQHITEAEVLGLKAYCKSDASQKERIERFEKMRADAHKCPNCKRVFESVFNV